MRPAFNQGPALNQENAVCACEVHVTNHFADVVLLLGGSTAGRGNCSQAVGFDVNLIACSFKRNGISTSQHRASQSMYGLWVL